MCDHSHLNCNYFNGMEDGIPVEFEYQRKMYKGLSISLMVSERKDGSYPCGKVKTGRLGCTTGDSLLSIRMMIGSS
jgi:hypothetical protein